MSICKLNLSLVFWFPVSQAKTIGCRCFIGIAQTILALLCKAIHNLHLHPMLLSRLEFIRAILLALFVNI